MGVITTLPVEFLGNNGSYDYTRERDLLELNIQAPKINYLPIDTINELECNYDGLMTKYGKCFHYNFNNIQRVEETYLLRIPIYCTIKDNEEKTMTLTFRISNCTENPSANMVRWIVRNNNTAKDSVAKEWHMQTDGLYSITFKPQKMDYAIDFTHQRFVNPYDFQFDLEIISLVEGDVSLNRINNSFMSAPVISIENSTNKLGEYELSRKINRHIKQIERNIQKEQDTFKITWR